MLLKYNEPLRQLFCINGRKKFLRLHLHPREGEPLLPEVFQGSSDVIDCAVDAEEAVMDSIESLYFNWSILCVVLGEIQFQLCGNGFGVDGCGNILPALVQHGQHRVVHIIVEPFLNEVRC